MVFGCCCLETLFCCSNSSFIIVSTNNTSFFLLDIILSLSVCVCLFAVFGHTILSAVCIPVTHIHPNSLKWLVHWILISYATSHLASELFSFLYSRENIYCHHCRRCRRRCCCCCFHMFRWT